MEGPISVTFVGGTREKAYYSPPWADMSIIGIAGSSGSGKTSLAIEIVRSMNLPWVIILSIVSERDREKESTSESERETQSFPFPARDQNKTVLTVGDKQDSFYKPLSPEQHRLAHLNQYDLDSPEAIDFDLLYGKLKDLKQGSDTRRATVS